MKRNRLMKLQMKRKRNMQKKMEFKTKVDVMTKRYVMRSPCDDDRVLYAYMSVELLVSNGACHVLGEGDASSRQECTA